MKTIPKKIFKSCFKFVFLISSRKGTIVTFLKPFFNAMIRNIKIHNILNIIENSKSMEPINVLIKKYENIYLNVSYDFAKFDGSKRIKV
jgi:hypothetical protein